MERRSKRLVAGAFGPFRAGRYHLRVRWWLFALTMSVAPAGACGGESPDENLPLDHEDPDPSSPVEAAAADFEADPSAWAPRAVPWAHAGEPQETRLGDWVHLDGRGSGGAAMLGYTWSLERRAVGSQLTLGTLAPIVSDGEGQAEFLPDHTGTFGIGLVVDDGELSSAKSFVHVRVLAPLQGPVAACETSTGSRAGEEVRLDGSGSVNPLAHIEPLQYYWEPASLPEDSRCLGTVSEVDQPALTFVPDVPGEYVFVLLVSAAGQQSPPAWVSVHVAP